MSNRKEVLEKYPYAYARKWTQQWYKDEWVIWNNNNGVMSTLGKGSTRKEAWEDAKNKLIKDV